MIDEGGALLGWACPGAGVPQRHRVSRKILEAV
jgi:hypothetical protein